MGEAQHTLAMEQTLENYNFGLEDANVKIQCHGHGHGHGHGEEDKNRDIPGCEGNRAAVNLRYKDNW